HPRVDEGLYAGLGLHVAERDGLQPAGGSVHHGEDVCRAVLCYRKRPHKVHVHVAEPLSWHVDGLDWSCWLAGHLGPAAPLAVPHPGGHVGVHTPPHCSGRNQPPRGA
ncbi:MAG: hypothetical protein ACK55I_08690, partial [bacterium]